MNPGQRYAPCPSMTVSAFLFGKLPMAEISVVAHKNIARAIGRAARASRIPSVPPTSWTFLIRSVMPTYYTTKIRRALRKRYAFVDSAVDDAKYASIAFVGALAVFLMPGAIRWYVARRRARTHPLPPCQAPGTAP